MRRQSAGDSSSKGTLLKMPALLTTASRRPNRSTAVRTIASPPSGLRHGVVRCHRHAARALDLFDDLVGDARSPRLAVHRAAEVVHHHRPAAPRDLHRVEAAEASTGSRDDRRPGL